ncbi:MAG: hypothetical protein KOO63_07855 [Bacteroidales bacterium]|nr:hypothetical protein [Candidatus Latescibacterota bacterium]
MTDSILALVVVVIVAIIFTPMFTIWAINALFSLNIELTLGTWLAALWVNGILYGSSK